MLSFLRIAGSTRLAALLCAFSLAAAQGQELRPERLPRVFPVPDSAMIDRDLREMAAAYFGNAVSRAKDCPSGNRYQWLRAEIMRKSGAGLFLASDIDVRYTGTLNFADFKVKRLYFRVREGIYATANLYIPHGPGPFPAVLHMPGHWEHAKLDPEMTAVGQSLAVNGYVCLTIDPWGSGERSTVHGESDYHGANLGASLMNLGETLLGHQLADNVRAVDLLCSLPYVDTLRIGATGASGGGSQTLWLAALDQRIRAVVTVVSAGTFEAFVMRRNCVCELLPDGLTFSEEFEVTNLVAPRAILMISHEKEQNPAFLPSEMRRTYRLSQPFFKAAGVPDHLAYHTIDTTHGYFREDRMAMIAWFNRHLKQDSALAVRMPEGPVVRAEDLMVFATGKRPGEVHGTAGYCRRQGSRLRDLYLQHPAFNPTLKRSELAAILRLSGEPVLPAVAAGSSGRWLRYTVKCAARTVPVLVAHPPGEPANRRYRVLLHPGGKDQVDRARVTDLLKAGYSVVLPDLSGTGELASGSENDLIRSRKFHTRARAELWVGRTILGCWTAEITALAGWLGSEAGTREIVIEGVRETALAALFASCLRDGIKQVILRDAPVSYLFDPGGDVNYFSMAVHLPGILRWGDVSLAAALSNAGVTFINPVSMGGIPLSHEQLKILGKEYETVRKRSQTGVRTLFKTE